MKKIISTEIELKDNYLKLSTTQKEIINLVYSLHREEIALNELWTIFVNKKGNNIIASLDELHYRVKDLEHKGFLVEKNIGYKTSIVITIPEIENIIRTQINFPRS
ncbi:hypothetical protein ACFL4Z_00970 [candidate division KSB1 bacterium]